MMGMNVFVWLVGSVVGVVIFGVILNVVIVWGVGFDDLVMIMYVLFWVFVVVVVIVIFMFLVVLFMLKDRVEEYFGEFVL